MWSLGGKAGTSACALGVFLLWMLTSFFCHKLAKTALELSSQTTLLSSKPATALVVTFVQLFLCYASVNTASTQGPLYVSIVTSHFLATLATNASMALTFASSTMAVKMMEPVTSALLQAGMSRRGVGREEVLGLIVMVVGALLFVGNPSKSGDMTRGILLALISNLALGVRNVAIKLSHGVDSSRNYQLRPVLHITGFILVVLLFLSTMFLFEARNFLPASATYFLALSVISGVFHVMYSYTSTNVVLRFMSVVSHALANIFKRVLVVLLLYMSGRRSASWGNWAGLGLCTAGLVMYNRKKLTMSSSPTSSVHSTGSSSHGKLLGTESSETSTSLQMRWKTLFGLLAGLAFTLVLILYPHLLPVTKHFHNLHPDHLKPHQQPPVFRHEQFSTEQFLRHLNQSYVLDKDRNFVSKVFISNPPHPGKSKTDYALNLRLGYTIWIDGFPLLKEPVDFQPDRKSIREIREFLSRNHLLQTPLDTDGLAPYLTDPRQVIEEMRRVQFNLFKDLFQGIKYAVLFGLYSNENKGDPAISVGELVLLEKMGIKLLFYVNVEKCKSHLKNVQHAVNIAKQYPRHEVVVLHQAMGNFFLTNQGDICREHVLNLASGFKNIILPGGIYMRGSQQVFTRHVNMFKSRVNLTVLFRDRLSVYLAQRLWGEGVRVGLCPDMAYQNEPVARFAAPYYDVLWQKRTDNANALFRKVPDFPSGIKLEVFDWLNMPSAGSKNSVVKAVNELQYGLGILQRGKVVVTDRLHGHILCTLMDIPHVLLDNADQKLSSFHNTWTRGISNCRLAQDGSEAARMALELLEEYAGTLPKRLTAVDIDEHNLQEISAKGVKTEHPG